MLFESVLSQLAVLIRVCAATAELLLCRGADVQLCWHAPSAFHKPETVAFLKLIYEDGAVVSWQGDHIVVISPIRIACLMLNSSMVKLLASRQQMRSSPGYMHSLHSGQMLDPASVPLVRLTGRVCLTQ